MNAKLVSEQEILNFLAESNKKITLKWSKMLFGKKHFKFLSKLWNNTENIRKLIPLEKLEEWEKDVLVLNQILKIESYMFEKYKKFLTYAVSKICKRKKSYHMHNDFINEAYIVFKKCIWYYTKSEYKFTTYLFRAICLKIHEINFRQKNSKLIINFASNNESLENLTIKKHEHDFQNIDSVSFDKIIKNCNLSEKELKALQLRFSFGKKWVKEAKNIILKTNGKSYTNYGLRIILQKAIDKLKKIHSKESLSLSA